MEEYLDPLLESCTEVLDTTSFLKAVIVDTERPFRYLVVYIYKGQNSKPPKSQLAVQLGGKKIKSKLYLLP